METKGWKVKVALDDEDCDVMLDCGVELDDTPLFLPRIGEVVWIDDNVDSALVEKVRSCYATHECKDCPFRFGEYFDVCDYIYVKDIVHEMDSKVVRLELSNKRAED